jgi:hypothetical protein
MAYSVPNIRDLEAHAERLRHCADDTPDRAYKKLFLAAAFVLEKHANDIAIAVSSNRPNSDREQEPHASVDLLT